MKRQGQGEEARTVAARRGKALGPLVFALAATAAILAAVLGNACHGRPQGRTGIARPAPELKAL